MPGLVILEIIWVMDSVYNYPRKEIIRALENLTALPILLIENHEQITSLCRIAKRSKLGLTDLLIGLSSKSAGCESTVTFDRKAAKSALFTLIIV